MTRAKRQTMGPDFDEQLTPKTQTDATPIDPADEELDNVFREFPQHDACLELWRTTEKGGKPSFLGDITPTEFTFGNIMREFGGGRYIVKGKYKNGEAIKRSFDIEGAPYPVNRKIPQPSGNAPAAPVVSGPTQQIEMVRREDGGYDMAASMMGMMKLLVTELKSSEDQVLDKMMKYKALFGSGEKQQTPIAEAIGMIRTGIELGQSGSGEQGGFPWLMALDKLQGPLTELVSTIKAAVTQPRPGYVPPNTLNPPPPGAEPQQEPAKPEGDQMQMILVGALRSMLPMLVTGAAKEADPGFYADLLLDQIPRQYYATAKSWLEKPDCLDQLQTMNAGVAPHLIWFGSLRAELLKALSEELGSDGTGSVQSQPTPDAPDERSTDL